jgi:hypothetical protein
MFRFFTNHPEEAFWTSKASSIDVMPMLFKSVNIMLEEITPTLLVLEVQDAFQDGSWKTKTCQSLHCTYIIFNLFNGFNCVTIYFLAFDVNWCTSRSIIKTNWISARIWNKYTACYFHSFTFIMFTTNILWSNVQCISTRKFFISWYRCLCLNFSPTEQN